MNDFNRLLALSGKNPKQAQLDQLTKDRDQLVESYNRSLQLVKAGMPLDEGIFSSIKIALGTATNFGKGSATKVKQKITGLSGSVKALYKSAKAKSELQYLVKGLQKILDDFEQLSIKTPTIINSDAEIKKELMLFKDIFIQTRDSLAARIAVAEGVERDDAALEFMLSEMNMHEDPITEEVDAKLISLVKDTPEFKEAAKRMKLVSTARQLKNGTLVFDTGMKGIGAKGKEEPNTAYLFKLYADGQVRAELKGSTYGYNDMKPSPHYRLGSPISGKDELDMYKKMLIDVVKRFEKKSARYGKESEIIAKRFKEFQDVLNAANAGTDAEEEIDHGNS